MNEYLIKALKNGRLKKGLKQSEVATMIGVKGGTLSNYENGISEPDIDTFASLCEIYELDFANVLAEAYGLSIAGTNYEIKPSEIEREMKIRALDEHDRKIIDCVINEAYNSRPRIMEGQLSLIPVNGYYQVYKNGKWENYKKCEDMFDSDMKPDVIKAAHNDSTDPAEQEKMLQDLENLKRPE